MDESHKSPTQSQDIKTVLPDVVHSQQIPTTGSEPVNETLDTSEINASQNERAVAPENNDVAVAEASDTESISEQLPSKLDYSLSGSENPTKSDNSHELPNIEVSQDQTSKNNSLNIPNPTSDRHSAQDASPHSTSWLDTNALSDVHHISEESPVNLALSSEQSKEQRDSKSETPQFSEQNSLKESPRSEFLDSLDTANAQNDYLDKDSIEEPSKSSSASEEIIKLDIRGSAGPKLIFPREQIIFGPPPEGGDIVEQDIEQIPVFQTLLSPFLVGAGDHVLKEVYATEKPTKDLSLEKSLEPSPEQSFSNEQRDLLVEELTVNESKEKAPTKEKDGTTPQPKSFAPEEGTPFSTFTEYKTICEEHLVKLVHLEEVISKRDELIEELTVSLQRSVTERDALRTENEHLSSEVEQLQHMVCERSQSEHDTIKAQLSDLVKYESMLKEDSTRFYSALMSGGSSVKSSNGEKDMDREEIVVNYSRSDLKSSEASDDFQTGFETKLGDTLARFDEFIEENLRNKLREDLMQVFVEEVGKLRLEYDTEVKDLEAQCQQEKQTLTTEARRLRELLTSVKSGDADIDALRLELAVKHEKEMENLRMYFEKKCSDMERSYSEEVWRGKTCVSPGAGSQSSGEWLGAAGDAGKRRARSADLPSLTADATSTPQAPEQLLRTSREKHLQQLEELREEQQKYVNELQARHGDMVAQLHEQIAQLKAQIQSAESTEANVSVYQQDIDLELEKKVECVRQEVIHQLQEQIQVLLSDPDAELSSWPLELVALRDKIHADKARDEKELTSLRDELSGGDGDKWKQRRNLSFDQNRRIEEVTRERDGLKRVAVTLQRVVSQLVAYCAAAEDELNKTVLGELLSHLTQADTTLDADSRPISPQDLSNSSLVSRGKHVHFAPDLQSILADLDEEDLAGFLRCQQDLSVEIKRELENSLLRLRSEAQELLELSSRVSRKEHNMLESSQRQITELVEKCDSEQRSCDNCEVYKKTMEEAMSECLQRENLLRSDLEAAMMKIAQLMTVHDRPPSTDIIAEGYGTVQHPRLPVSLPARSPPRGSAGSSAGSSQSLDGSASPRAGGGGGGGGGRALQLELDALLRDRDELRLQLESANRQLKSTRQFVEEQATEREAERDEFAKRIADARDENARLATRLQNNARILNEVEQLEEQTREMTEIIAELEERKSAMDDDLKSSNEKISLLRDIIANLEQQLEQKTTRETDILNELEGMKRTIEERDGKMRGLLAELETLKSERGDSSGVMCARCAQGEDRYADLLAKVKEQGAQLTRRLTRRTRRTQRAHELCSASASASEPSEDMSPRDKLKDSGSSDEEEDVPAGASEAVPELRGVWDALGALARAGDAALKRVADLEMQRARLKQVAEEVRAERDVLQTRMSEQALRISSLAARLETQRNHASALAHTAASELTVQLHDAKAEVQRLSEELEARERQLARLRHSAAERDQLADQHVTLYGNSCNPKDKVIILERELSSAQTRIAQLESLVRGLEEDKDGLLARLRAADGALAERDVQLQEILALKLEDEENEKSEQKSEVNEGKVSARTLSDIVSISEFDEQDLQMRRAELRALNLSGAPYQMENREKSQLNRTLPPEVSRPNMSSLNVDFTDHFDLANISPRADSLPLHLTSTQNKDLLNRFKRNVNETTLIAFGDSVKHSTAQDIPDNMSMYPNRDVSDSKNRSVEPKKIDFSLEASKDNKTHDEHEFTCFRDLGIDLDIRKDNIPEVLSTLKQEIIKAKAELKNAEEQLCEFPTLKEEVEELKSLLENTMATMENDKKFYENQLDHFSSNKTLLEQRLTELTQEVNDRSRDLHVLKEDILKRENMILELAKEKRNLTNKLTELDMKIDELQSRNTQLQKYESESQQMKEKLKELQKLEQLVSEKNQQIDSLNQHLDRLDDLQRCLNDKTEEFDNLKEAFEEKSNELFQMQDTVEALNRDLANVHEENSKLNLSNKDLKLKLTKLEKEQENQSLKLQSSESELERLNALNTELSSKIGELKLLTDKLKDKDTEIDILNEDINAFHEEIASLKEQLKMVSRSPSPKSKNGEEKTRTADRQASSDKKQLVKIRKQISMLQHELDFHKKELNDKAFELAKAKLDITELKTSASDQSKQAAERERVNGELARHCHALRDERERLLQRLQQAEDRLREESNITELKQKLSSRTEQCQALEKELYHTKELLERAAPQPAGADTALVRAGTGAGAGTGARSPTAELERALRDQLDYSHRLDEDIMEQILSAGSDDEDVPRLQLSKSCSSAQSASSEGLQRARAEAERLRQRADQLEARLRDKDALIAELNRIRDKLVQDWQAEKLRGEAERDNAGRLQLLLVTHQETADSLQNQDSNMISILKKRLESSMAAELELQQSLQQHKAQLQRALAAGGASPLQHAESEETERLRGELTLARSRLEAERGRLADAEAALARAGLQHRREVEARQQLCSALRADLAEHKRLKHDASIELLRSKELLNMQSSTISELEKKLAAAARKQRPIDNALTEIEVTKSELAHELATLRSCLRESGAAPHSARPLLARLQADNRTLADKVSQLEEAKKSGGVEEKDQAIRYLHGRCLRLESCRKALVWQKRYLQRALQGYTELEQRFRVPAPRPLRGVRRFKRAAQAVVVVLRMQYLVQRRRGARAAAAHCLLRARTERLHTPASQYASTSPPSRDAGAGGAGGAGDVGGEGGAGGARDSLARRVLKHELRLSTPGSPMLGVHSPRFDAQSPRDEPFHMSSPSGDVASLYLSKLELVTRCLNRAVDSREVP